MSFVNSLALPGTQKKARIHFNCICALYRIKTAGSGISFEARAIACSIYRFASFLKVISNTGNFIGL